MERKKTGILRPARIGPNARAGVRVARPAATCSETSGGDVEKRGAEMHTPDYEMSPKSRNPNLGFSDLPGKKAKICRSARNQLIFKQIAS